MGITTFGASWTRNTKVPCGTFVELAPDSNVEEGNKTPQARYDNYNTFNI